MSEKIKKQVPSTNMGLLRSPIVVVLGHVDHGKSSLLQYIRKTEMLTKEAGGITQATGAYEVLHNGKRLTFLDTPGHEAFSKMRGRGAKVADLAILVVAADDGVKPQTKESIQILSAGGGSASGGKQSATPFVVAINKVDKNNADVERVKRELSENGVLLEGYGGDVSFELISAKNGEGVDKLLDLVLFAAEFQDLSYSPDAPASGVIIEAKLDKFRGNEVTAVLKDGTLKKWDDIFTATARGKVKALQNFLRENVAELQPSSPALILGFEELPQIGEEFLVGERPKIPNQELRTANPEPKVRSPKSEVQSLVIILKADTSGSLEAASQILGALTIDDVGIHAFSEGVGNISDQDIKDAAASGATIIGFNTRADKAVETLAQNQNVKIMTSSVIYDLVQKLQEELKRIKTPPPQGILEVLKIFSQKNKAQLIGGKVLEGELRNRAYFDVFRGDTSIDLIHSTSSGQASSLQAGGLQASQEQDPSVESSGEPVQTSSAQAKVLGGGYIKSLKVGKQDASRVEAGKECGVMLESSTTIEVGDKIVVPPPTK